MPAGPCALRAARLAKRLAEPILEEHAVRQAGQGIVKGLVRELFLESFSIRDIAGDDRRTNDIAAQPADR